MFVREVFGCERTRERNAVMNKKVRVIRADGSKTWGYASTEHSASSYGLPVIVVGGEAYGASDLENERMRVICNDAEVRKALIKAGYSPEEMEVSTVMIACRLRADIVEQIDDMANRQKRSRNAMIEILLEKAFDAQKGEGGE